MTISQPTLDISALDSALAGRAHGPGDEGWDAARTPWNLAADQHPVAVAVPATPEDVQEVVRFARAHGLRVAAQGPGHGARSFASLDGTILVRTGELRTVETDADRRLARVGAGVLAHELGERAGEHGLAPLSGSSPDVGVAGFALGGGIGWLSRGHGLAANSVRAFELVTAAGDRVRADAERESDLFWALRGGGGGFGIVTALEVELLPIAEVFAGLVVFEIEHAGRVLRAYRDWASSAPREVTSSVRFLRPPPLPDVPEPLRGRELVGVTAAHPGPESEAAELLRPVREAAPAVLDTFATIPAAGLCRIHGDPEQPVPGLGGQTVLAELPDEAIDVLVALEGPGSGTPMLQVDLRHLGGALAEAPAGAGALSTLAGEYALFAVGIPMGPDVAERIADHLGRMQAELSPWSTGRPYLNFTETPTDPATAFDADVHGRLLEVKRAVDPDNLIRSGHELRPSG